MTRGSACPMVAHLQAQLRQWYEHTPFAASFYDQPVMPAELYQEDMFLGALMYAACIHAQAVGNDLRIGCIVNPDALLGWVPTLTEVPADLTQVHTLWWYHLRRQFERLAHNSGPQTPKALDGLCAMVRSATQRGSKHLIGLEQTAPFR